jgi:hypothetical protein
MRYFVNLQIHFFDENFSHQYLKSELSGIVGIAPINSRPPLIEVNEVREITIHEVILGAAASSFMLIGEYQVICLSPSSYPTLFSESVSRETFNH